MFRDDVQRAEVCRAVLRQARLDFLWPDDAPAPPERLIDLWETNGGPLSSGERKMVLVVQALWTGDARTLRFDEVLYGLDAGNARCVGHVLVALASGSSYALDIFLTSGPKTQP